MTAERTVFTPSNPFVSRRIRPGAIPYFFSDGQDLRGLIEKFHSAADQGEIVGPHGSGKSTLLAALLNLLREEREVVHVELHDGERRLPIRLEKNAASRIPTTLAVDGYEQLSRWSRFRTMRFCRKAGWGLLVTSHSPIGLPELFRTETDDATAQKIVTELLREGTVKIPPTVVSESLARRRGDMREALFDLYDYYEALRR